jgi:DNA adenine methylase
MVMLYWQVIFLEFLYMVNYFGSKKNIEIPGIDQDGPWLDLFGGGGSVTFNRPYTGHREVWNDLYEPGVWFFQYLKNDFQALYNKCWDFSSLTISIAEIISNYHLHSKLTVAAAFFVYSEKAFNGNAGCNWDVGLMSTKQVDLRKLHQLRRRFHDVEILNLDFRECLEYIDDPETIVYADPPYVFESRKSKDTRSDSDLPRRRYFHEFTRQDHIDLANLLIKRKAIVSGLESELYADLYRNFEKIRLGKEEIVWKNF